MPGRARVHELAEELGTTPKELLAWCRANDEFVKSASSTVEAPVARRLRAAFSPEPNAAAPAMSQDAADPGAAVLPAAPPRGAQKPRSMVLAWGAADWQRARHLAPGLEHTLRLVCKLHQKVAVFDAEGALALTLRPRLSKLSHRSFAVALGPLLAALDTRLSELEAATGPAQAESSLAEDPEVGPALAALAASRMDFPESFRVRPDRSAAEADSHEGDEGVDGEEEDASSSVDVCLDSAQPACQDLTHEMPELTDFEVAAPRARLGDLERRQDAVVAAAQAAHAAAAAGRLVTPEHLRVLAWWNDQLQELAGCFGSAATIADLREAVAASELAAQAESRLEEITRLLEALGAASPSAGAAHVLQPVLDRIRSADASEMDDDSVDAHRALARLLSVHAWDVADQDRAVVEAHFGGRLMVVAASEVLELPQSATSPSPVRAAPSPASIGSDPAPDPRAVPPVGTSSSDEPGAAASSSPPTGVPEEQSPASVPAPRDGSAVGDTSAAADTHPAAPQSTAQAPEVPSVTARSREDRPSALQAAAGTAEQATLDGAVPIGEPAPAEAPGLRTVPPEEAGGEGVRQHDALRESALDPGVASALAEGAPALAYWYSVATGAARAVQSVLEVLALSEAICVDGDDVSMRGRDLLQTLDADAISGDGVLIKLVAAAAARVALRMPFSPATDLLTDSCMLLGDQPPFLDAARQAAARGVELKSLQDENRKSLPELIAVRDDALDVLRQHVEVAGQRRTRMARSSNVWRQLLATRGRLGRPVSRTLDRPEDLGPAEGLLSELKDVRNVDRMLDDLDAQLHPIAARKNKITAGARSDLRELIAALLRVLQDYVEAAHAVTNREQQHSSNDALEALEVLTQAVSAEWTPDGEPDAGDTALLATQRWIHGVLQRRVELPTHHTTPAQALARPLALVYEVTRDGAGTIDPATVTAKALQASVARSPEAAYDGFVARDDHVGVEGLLDALRAEGRDGLADALGERQREDLSVSRERLRRLIAETDRTLALALSTALLSESESTALRADVERVRAEQAVDFVAARRELQRIINKVSTAQARALDQARQQLAASAAPDPVKRRIAELLDDGDLVNAQEFLSQVAAGAQELPEEAEADRTLTDFWPSFPQAAERASLAGDAGAAEIRWLRGLAAERGDIAGRTLLPPDASPIIAQGLEAWAALATDKRKPGYERHLKAVLQMVGLETKAIDQKEKHQALRWWTTVKADRVGQALVAAYGSGSNGQYQVLLCWDRVSADRLLDIVEERPASPPTIVLYFHTLSARERRALADRSRPQRKNVSTVVIDHATVAFLATGRDVGLHTSLGISLPFTSINPYTPFALGDVPREVFYGRKRELRRVQDPNDALFVYGGRQLGKSALLKTAMREFRESDPRWRSIYVDLKAEGVGEWRQPEDIWQVLLPQLISAEVVDAKVSAKAPPDVIVGSVRRWLDADKDRRFLLLLDEADAFLETDARARPGAVGDARFVNVYRLKSLMDGTSRRFKPVFAGLHQVQRFHTTSNGPMAHVGAEIPIGPLPPAEAFKLVVKPLAAVGYHFTTPDAVWRLLNYTNYQASLIQLFCDALVKRLHRRGLAAGAPPTSVDSDLVDEVYADKELRDQIATRFEWTINLDNRYRVIAYATAWLSLNGATQLFPALTLHDECATFWPTGFQDLSLDTFAAYLDEMVGLGVLVRTPEDHYGIRSPNVIRLLGAPEEIERRLEESEKLELSRPFDPALYRRALNGEPDTRSPLSELQAKQLLDGRGVVHLVVGTSALGLARVGRALAESGGDEVSVRTCDAAGLTTALTELSRRRSGRTHLVVDGVAAGSDQVLTALRRLYRQLSADERLTASWLTPVDAKWLDAAERDPDLALQRTALLPWTDDALQAWAPECGYPLVSDKERAELLEDTGGWPAVVEAAAAAARTGVPAARARAQAVESVCGGDRTTAFLISVGLRGDPHADKVAEVVAGWSDELQFADLAELVDIPMQELLPVVGRLVDMAVLRRTATGDSYRVNPLVARLLKSEL